MADIQKNEDDKLSNTGDDSDDLPPAKEFAAISHKPSKVNSRSNSMSRRTLSRTRSNNGYGCDEDDNSREDLEISGDGVVEKDPFEVHWEDGDNDPLNPRSMSFARKWLVVIIVSASSLCVYVISFGRKWCMRTMRIVYQMQYANTVTEPVPHPYTPLHMLRLRRNLKFPGLSQHWAFLCSSWASELDLCF
jgi:hypothetical protein